MNDPRFRFCGNCGSAITVVGPVSLPSKNNGSRTEVSIESATLSNSAAFRDVVAIPDFNIIGDFGGVVEDLGNSRPGLMLYPMSRLPYPKHKIELTLERALNIASDKGIRHHLEAMIFALNCFVPDSELPSDPVLDHAIWLSRIDLRNPRMVRVLQRMELPLPKPQIPKS